MTTKRETKYTRKAPGLYLRTYVREGQEYGAIWTWKSRWKGKMVEVPFGTPSMIPEPAAVEWVRTCALRKKAGWTLKRIKDDTYDLLIMLNDGRLAQALDEAKRMNPIAGALLAHKSREIHTTGRELAEALVKAGV